MILGLQMYGPLAKKAMDEKQLFNKIKDIGFDRIEPCICFDEKNDKPSFWSVEHFEEVYPVIKEMGLDIISCHVRAEDLKKALPKMCELAEKFKIKHFVVGLGEANEIAIQERAFIFRAMADELEKYGARILLHNGKTNTSVMINNRTAYEYMVDICLGKVGMQFDIGWAMAGGTDPFEIVKRNENRIESLHFKDFKAPGVSDVDCVIGEGKADNELFMQFGRAKGIPLFVDQDAYEDVVADACKSYTFLQDADII